MKKNWPLFGLGCILIATAVWQIVAAQSGLQIIRLHSTNPPVTIIAPSNISPASRPTVLIAHGFAGSSLLMRSFALTLAHAGYVTVSWDFEGHASNPNSFTLTSGSADLLHDAESALNQAESTGLIDPQRVAILGHSMGSGVAILYGVTHPDTSGTIAISPVPQVVNPSLPHNLLLMAGNLEPQFVSSANQLLNKAGGVSDDVASGTARKLVVVSNVEHISILFSHTAHNTARSWLDGVFGIQPGAQNYTDRRILWYGLGIIGFCFLSIAGIHSFPRIHDQQVTIAPIWLRLTALIAGGIGATILLYLESLLWLSMSQMFGMLVGGYIIVWFSVAGMIALLVLRPTISEISANDLLKSLIAFAALWLGVGLLGNYVWLPWLLIPSRLALWIPAATLVFPYFLAVGEVAKSAKWAGQIGWWLAQVLVVIGSLYLALRLTSDLGFIFLILPVIPIMLGLQFLAVSPKRSSSAFAFSGALFTGWLLLTVFPIL